MIPMLLYIPISSSQPLSHSSLFSLNDSWTSALPLTCAVPPQSATKFHGGPRWNRHLVSRPHSVESQPLAGSFGPRSADCFARRRRVERPPEAVNALHDADYVHGSLPESNYLTITDGSRSVDFDWCGGAGTVRYSAVITLIPGFDTFIHSRVRAPSEVVQYRLDDGRRRRLAHGAEGDFRMIVRFCVYTC